MIRLISYAGLGFLAHWLWIGATIDPTNTFTWVCLLLGPLMCLAWVISKMFWLGIAAIVLGVLFGIAVLFADELDGWINRMKRRKKKL